MSFLRSNGIWMACMAAGLLLLLIGLAEGQATAVFMKAVRVCLECIGIG